jgi:hypothetical protein
MAEENVTPWRPEEADLTLPNGHVYRFRRPPARAITQMGLIVVPSKMQEPPGEAVAETLPSFVQRARYESDLRANDALRAFLRCYAVDPVIVGDGEPITDPAHQVAFDRPPAEGDEDLLLEPIMQRFFRPRGGAESDVPPVPGSVGG